jgi:hypothetical protein
LNFEFTASQKDFVAGFFADTMFFSQNVFCEATGAIKLKHISKNEKCSQ